MAVMINIYKYEDIMSLYSNVQKFGVSRIFFKEINIFI